mgnify:CR=1 FL=1
MAQIDLDGYNSRLYINELRSQSTSTIVIPSSTTLVVDTIALTNVTGTITIPTGQSMTITDPLGLNVGGVPIKSGGVKAWENKSATFTAVSGQSYIVDTTSGAFDVSLPNGPIYGDTVVFLDAAGLFGTNNMTLLGNGEKVVRVVGQDLAVDEDDTYIEMVYSGTSFGWLVGATNLVL